MKGACRQGSTGTAPARLSSVTVTGLGTASYAISFRAYQDFLRMQPVLHVILITKSLGTNDELRVRAGVLPSGHRLQTIGHGAYIAWGAYISTGMPKQRLKRQPMRCGERWFQERIDYPCHPRGKRHR